MAINISAKNEYQKRHIGPDTNEQKQMLEAIGVASLDQLIHESVPDNIRLDSEMNIPEGISEFEFLKHVKSLAAKNQVFKSYIGLGFYDTITPSVILRNIFENPGWYTQYTPYQAEIAQGRLEALLNFQTMVIDLTGMEIANASLLDEPTAAAEAMTMLFRIRKREKQNAKTFLVSDKCFPQTVDLLKTRALPMDINIKIVTHDEMEFNEDVYGLMLQYPGEDGSVEDLSGLIKKAHENNATVAVAADLLSLTLLTPPGEWGADVVVGSAQRLGVPMGYGGPHAGFFATREEYKRQVPGRIIGVSIDRLGNKGYRMALQTSEQHIRGEKATSNICTAQSLLAIMAGMYGVYHGPQGLKRIAAQVHFYTDILSKALKDFGFKQINQNYFDTLTLHNDPEIIERLKNLSNQKHINLRFYDQNSVAVSLDETTSKENLKTLVNIFAEASGKSMPETDKNLSTEMIELSFDKKLQRSSLFMEHEVFNSFHSETKMMRYIKSLENKDLALNAAMIPLGSCTMKLNPATAMIPVSWPDFGALHPFIPIDQAKGYYEMMGELDSMLKKITGFAAVSLQPNSGAQGEYAGLMVIRAYFEDRGEKRDVVLVPSSAHGTNPASAKMAGMKIVVVKCDEIGDVDVDDLKMKAEEHKNSLAALMITYPSTHGVFESRITEICKIIHDNGGQVYMDGANMNAQVGLTNPGLIGADVCHLNLHKTFSIPHGGGGPGMGPIAVAEHLAPYLPGHPLVKTGGEKAISAISGTPYGSPSIMLISYAYMKMLGGSGMKAVSENAILNANYIKARLEKYYKILYTGETGRVAHEMIVDLRDFKRESGIEVEDIAKRLIDYGFHAPTVSWPVPGTMMIEPTESESKDELDRFCDALISIYDEIKAIEKGELDKQDNPLKNAPHTDAEVVSDGWNHSYSREQAAFPLEYIRSNKFWPAVARVDNTYGDRNLVCACPPVEIYNE